MRGTAPSRKTRSKSISKLTANSRPRGLISQPPRKTNWMKLYGCYLGELVGHQCAETPGFTVQHRRRLVEPEP